MFSWSDPWLFGVEILPNAVDKIGAMPDNALHLLYNENLAMKTTTLPPLRVTQELRASAEAVLDEGETLSSFVLDAVTQSIAQRRSQQAFIARGLASRAKAQRSGRYVTVEAVIRKLRGRLAKARRAGEG